MSTLEEAQLVQLSKAVALQLTEASQAGKLGRRSFQAKHRTLPINKLPDLASLDVTTRGRADARQFASRTKRQHDYLIEVTLREMITAEESLQVDELILLGEKIADFYEVDDTTTGQTRTVTGRSEKLVSPVETIVDEESLHQQRVLKCTVNLTFRGWR